MSPRNSLASLSISRTHISPMANNNNGDDTSYIVVQNINATQFISLFSHQYIINFHV